jgi:hypothetical protein
VLLAAAAAHAQQIDASLAGTITDPAGASLPGAAVSARNVNTNLVARALTGVDGGYVIPRLPTGTYVLSVEASGFKTYTRRGIVLSVGDQAQVDVAMQIGDSTQSVTVTEELGTVETNQSVMGLVTDEKVISEVPLSGRQVWELLLYSAGVVFTTPGQLNPMNTAWDVHGNYSIKGGVPYTNLFLVDGAPLGATAKWNSAPMVDAIEEFKVGSPVSDASYGLTGGGVVSVRMKSGTNELHGSLSEFLQNIKMDAATTQANRAKAQNPNLKDQNTRNSIAARLAGPLIKNKCFYTGHYERTTMSQGRPYTVTIPTMDQRAGNFTTTRNAAGQMVAVYDPLTTHASGNRFERDPFPGNVLPGSRISLPAKSIDALAPVPNLVTNPVTNVNNYAGVPNSRIIHMNNYYVKADYLWNERNRTSASQTYMWNNNDTPPANAMPRGSPLRNQTYQTRTHYGAVLDHLLTVGNSWTVDGRAAWDRFVGTGVSRVQQDFDGSQLGFKGLIGSSPVNHFPVVNLTDYLTWGSANTSFSPEDLYSMVVDASKTLGRQTIRFGGRAAQAVFSNINPGQWFGNFTFNRGSTQVDPQRADTTSGNSVASFLLGYAASGYADVNPASTYQNKAFGLYLQDDIKLNRRWTVNAGLRWDVQTAPTERFNRQIYTFDPAIAYQLGPSQAKGGFVYADQNHRQPWDTKYRNFQPRAGSAFRVTKWLTARGGYGISFLPLNGTLGGGGIQQDGFSRRTSMVVTQGAGANLYIPGLAGTGTFDNPFPNGIVQPYGSSLGSKTMVGQAVSYVTRDFQIGRVSQFYAGFGLQLPWKVNAELAYVGTRSQHLRVSVNENAIPLAELQKSQTDPNYLTAAFTNPFYPAPELVGTNLNTPTMTRNQLVRPYPQFISVTNTGAPLGSYSYNGFELRTQRRMASGLVVTLNYTLSKTLQALTWREDVRDVPRVLADFDHTHNLNIIALWELPFGKKRHFGSAWNRPLNAALGGWQLNAVMQYQNGAPIAMPGAVVVSNPALPSGQQTFQRWFNTCTLLSNGSRVNCASASEQVAWRQANPGETVNNSVRIPNIRVHSLPQVNVSLFKDFRIREKWRLELRGEAFNATNSPIYGSPDTSLTSATFGVVTLDQWNLARSMQLALKLVF